MHLQRGFAGLVEREHLRHRRMDARVAHETIRLPRLAVVREVATLQRLQVHPEVAVVVLDLEPRRGRARDDHAAALGDEHRRAHRRAARVFEHDVDVAPDEAADLLAEPQPLGRVLFGVVGVPELVVLGAPVDHGFTTHRAQQLGALLRRHDTDRSAAAVEHVLRRVRTDATGRAPDEHRLTLRHLRTVLADDHAVARGVAQRVARGLFPREVRGLRHELVRLHDRDLGEPAEVRLEAPDALVRGHHRVVVRGRVLVVDVQTVRGDDVARLPVPHRGPHRNTTPLASDPITWYG